jgi:hypothetical protein
LLFIVSFLVTVMELLTFIWKLLVNLLVTAGHAFWTVARPMLASKSVLLSLPRSVGFALAGGFLTVLEIVLSVFRANRRPATQDLMPVADDGVSTGRRGWFSQRFRYHLQVATAMVVVVGMYGWLAVWAVTWMFGGPKEDVRAAHGLGQRMAEETVRLLPQGGKVVVVAWDRGYSPIRMQEQSAQLKSFRRFMGRHRQQIDLAAIEWVDLDQVDRATGRLKGVFSDVLEKHPDASIVVSMIGVPDIERVEIEKLGRKLPAFVVVTDMQEKTLEPFFQNSLVTVAIVPRLEPVTDEEHHHEPVTASEWFERSYKVIRQPQS